MCHADPLPGSGNIVGQSGGAEGRAGCDERFHGRFYQGRKTDFISRTRRSVIMPGANARVVVGRALRGVELLRT
jgi:hypothetical protein